MEAYAWWLVAATNGDTVAEDNMGQLRTKLTPSEVARAVERSKRLALKVKQK